MKVRDAPSLESLRQEAQPFVLIDFGGRGRLYRNPSHIVEARRGAEVLPALRSLAGKRAAGFISYEAGYALEPKVAHLLEDPAAREPPLLWFGIFDEEPEAVPRLPDPAGAWAGPPRPLIARDDYVERIATLREHLLAGDIYQANFTFPAEVGTAGEPLALYAQLKERAQAPWSALVFTRSHWILSCSPENFFTLEDRRVTTRPMKGTAAPGSPPESLRNDPKQRAENLMIVDLLRNDLSKVSVPGTVETPELLAVEEYPTVLQMTSTITSTLKDGLGPVDVVEALFPCGSITGAPKIRAMEIIHRQEMSARGVYTGAIGHLDPDGSAQFNVAIRTLSLRHGEGVARCGLGSGIVVDSEAKQEWLECLQKGKFIPSDRPFDLIETLRVDAGCLPDLPLHLDRLARSAAELEFRFDREEAERIMLGAAQGAAGNARLRMVLSRDGGIALQIGEISNFPSRLRVALRPMPADRRDFRLRHKTSDRAFYDDAREACGAPEVIFEDAEGFITEGSLTSVFVRIDGRLATPPLGRGLLPGILRGRLLASGEAVEQDIRRSDLGNGFFVGNSVRGLVPATLDECQRIFARKLPIRS